MMTGSSSIPSFGCPELSERPHEKDDPMTMNAMKKATQAKKPYCKPVLKVVKVRPKEVLGSSCHNSSNTGVSPCDFSVCSVD